MKKLISVLLPILVFLFGLALFLYPTISNLYNEHKNSLLIDNYKETTSDIQKLDKEKFLNDAHTYNQHLYDTAKLEELGLNYESVLNMYGNGVMGYLEIPKISVELIIYHTVDENLLQDAIGHVQESSLPVGGKSTHAVLAGHRGLPSAKLLTNIDHLKYGDVFYIHILDEVLEYRVDDISIVEPDDVSKIRIVNGKDYVTLVTCTPYGINSHRLLVRGERVPENEVAYNGDNLLNISDDIFHINPIYIVPIVLIVLILVSLVIRFVKDKRKKQQNNESGDDNETNA